MKSSELRNRFLSYFKENGHSIIESSPLIPIGDPTLLFNTAGMVQFKPMFAGESDLKYTRATSCQKCIRTTDLENVGRTPRHHTFFEMLGNFSFGDYFKKGSIEFAWNFSTEIIKLDPKRIYISVYEKDDEAFELWEKHIGIPKKRMTRLGKKDNFWGPAGNSGACGPCSELYYDLGEDMLKPGDNPGVGDENNRYIEYWNLVFNQFNQLKNGELTPLPRTGIDTGMGLERLAIITQGVKSVYETDLFKPFIKKISQITGKTYNKSTATPYHVIADHIRAITFIIAENILPSNEGRGYVIRRILRRAMRYGQSIGLTKPFLNELIPVVTEIMGDAYPELKTKENKIKTIVHSEEESFLTTLEEGSHYLENLIRQSKEKKLSVIASKEAFKLYDSMGFPIDITRDIAEEHSMTVDIAGYEKLMDEQKSRGRSGSRIDNQILPESILEKKIATKYSGEESSQSRSKILHILKVANDKGKQLIESDNCSTNSDIAVIVSESPFYGESGGQAGDHGILKNGNGKIKVIDTQKINDIILHYGTVETGQFKINDPVTLVVDDHRKKTIAGNHSATHLLQYSLQKVLGDHIRQLGSLVNDEKLRFDFSHFNALTKDELEQIETEVNQMIRDDSETNIESMEKEEAFKAGAMAFFGDKYDQTVRTVKIGDSFELCGGTHVKRSGEIGCFKIIAESSISSGTRRIEAVTGEKAIQLYIEQFNISRSLEQLLNTTGSQLYERISNLMERNKSLEKNIKALKMQHTVSNIDDTIEKSMIQIGDVHFVSFSLPDKDINELRTINDQIKNKYKNLITFLLSEKDTKVFYISTVSKDLSSKPIKADELVKSLSEMLGGKGGGKGDRAQGSGTLPQNIEKSIIQAKQYIEKLLS